MTLHFINQKEAEFFIAFIVNRDGEKNEDNDDAGNDVLNKYCIYF